MATELKRLGFVPKYSAAGLEAVTGSKTCVCRVGYEPACLRARRRARRA